MSTAITKTTVSSSSGVATVKLNMGARQIAHVTVIPDSASGTGTITARPIGIDTFGPVADSAGSALTTDLSAQSTHRFLPEDGVEEVKITSDNSGDTFDVTVVVY